MIQIILVIYFTIAAISGFITVVICITDDLDGIDSVWDWVIYNVFWIFHLIKPFIKMIKNLIK